ncbi:MAG: hypothetical protein H6993_16195 [Pseudomonadales bacterium]|nr:hypothetical protein [Pseudomonadales bacterium]MCP5185506.1 hypothetical protein [Pseudomonadales bacterium]
MRHPILLTVLLACVQFPAVAWADDEKSATPTEVRKEQRVCKRIAVTGSRVKERVCRSQRDWDRLAKESQESVDRAKERGRVSTGES